MTLTFHYYTENRAVCITGRPFVVVYARRRDQPSPLASDWPDEYVRWPFGVTSPAGRPVGLVVGGGRCVIYRDLCAKNENIFMQSV